MRMHHLSCAALAAVACVLGTAAPARAQGQGPLVMMPLENRVVIAPDVKFTNINGATGTIIGAYAGVEIDNRFFAGGAGYWLADPRDTTELFYVGFIAGWQVVNSDRFHLGVRGLAGIGEATAYADMAHPVPYPMPTWDGRHGGGDQTMVLRVGRRSGVFVAEPEVRAEIGLTDQLRFGLGVGYRITSADAWLGDRLQGVTGSISLQIGLGK